MEFHKVEKIVGPNPTIDTNKIFHRNVAQPGRALALGAWGRRSESCHSDNLSSSLEH